MTHPEATPRTEQTEEAAFKNPRALYGYRLRGCSIAGVGARLPERVVTNAELAGRLGTTEDWILARTGIRERRMAREDESTSDLAAAAARQAMARADITAPDVEMIVVATNTPDMTFPATACLVQSKLGAKGCAAFDLKAAGCGFLFALEVAQQFIQCGTLETVLVIGAEKLSPMVDARDRDTSVLFGDGAGAVVLRHAPGRQGLFASSMGGQSGTTELLFMPGGGSRQPATPRSILAGEHFLRMHGRQTFKQAVQVMQQAATGALDRCGLRLDDIRCIIPHQANQRILDAVALRLGARPDQFFMNLERYGNTGGASMPIALEEAVASGRIRRGDLVMFLAFGAGLTWGASVVEW